MKTTIRIFVAASIFAIIIFLVEVGLIWYFVAAWGGAFLGFVTAAMLSSSNSWDVEYLKNRNQGLEDKILELETQKSEMEIILNKTQDKLDVKDALLKTLEDNLAELVHELEDNKISVIQEKRERAKEFLDSSSIDELNQVVTNSEVTK